MSFYTCDCCDKKIDYGNSDEAVFEITKLDLKFCGYDCLKRYFKELEERNE